MQESVCIPASRSRAAVRCSRATVGCSRTAAHRSRAAAGRSRVVLAALVLLALFACGRTPPREIGELVVRDSTYLDPETLLPYSGRVFRDFPGEDGGTQLEATLRDGTWEGEFTIYHETGRIRYEGEMSGGSQCGAWVENDSPVEPESVYEAIKEDLESLVIYPDCGEG